MCREGAASVAMPLCGVKRDKSPYQGQTGYNQDTMGGLGERLLVCRWEYGADRTTNKGGVEKQLDVNAKNKNDCIDYWRALREKIARFDKLDDVALVFGARTRGQGHDYEILPIVSNEELLAFENANGFELPFEYRTYLQTFGAGGAGPNYGIGDFRKYVLPYEFKTPFPYEEEVYYDDVSDDDPVWDQPGLAFVSNAGCGTEFHTELNGPAPGTLWCAWAEACSRAGTFLGFYQEWADKVENGLERYHLLKSFIDEKTGRLKPKGLMLDDVADKMQCAYQERGRDWSSSVAEGETWVHFDKTPGRVIIDNKKKVIQIDVFRSCSIT